MTAGTAEWLYERDVKRLTLRIAVEQHDALVTLSRASGNSINSLVCDAIHDYLLANGRWEEVERWLQRTGVRYRAQLNRMKAPPPSDPYW